VTILKINATEPDHALCEEITEALLDACVGDKDCLLAVINELVSRLAADMEGEENPRTFLRDLELYAKDFWGSYWTEEFAQEEDQ
jgi:hypothetical protein